MRGIRTAGPPTAVVQLRAGARYGRQHVQLKGRLGAQVRNAPIQTGAGRAGRGRFGGIGNDRLGCILDADGSYVELIKTPS